MQSIAQIVQKQKAYFAANTTKPVSYRKAQLKKLKSLLQENEPLLYKAIYADFKKSEFDTYTTELSLIYHDIDLALKKLNAWCKPKRVPTNIPNLPAQSLVIAEPFGTCTVIGAWNYPIQLCLVPLVGAMMAGNTGILKPSELTPNTSALLAKLINSNFDPSYLYVHEGGIPETTELLKQKVDFIFFTGSTHVGKIVYKAAAENLTPVVLEMGGKSPAIISQHTNLKMAAKRLIWAKFLNSGQTCIAPDYVLVDESVKNEFISFCKAEIEKAQYKFENQNYVQIINDKHFERLTNYIAQSNDVYGGASDESSRFIAPTLLLDATLEDAVMQEEIFGPVLPIITFSNFDDALTTIKNKDKPLSAYLFTENSEEKKNFQNTLSFGGGCINDAVMHITNANLPFGGVGASGIGNYHGKYSFKTFTHQKSVLKKPTWLELPLKYPPYSPQKLKWIKRLLRF